MNIFSGIWKKHFRKGAPAARLADDLGALKGKFSVTRYDPRTGQRFETYGQDNLLVNQSKTNLIRLISQGQSPWIGDITPADLKIQRMRFGNDAGHPTPSRLNYYKFDELSTRRNDPMKQVGELTARFAGGLSSQAYIPSIGTFPEEVLGTAYTTGLNSTKKYAIPKCMASDDPALMPSHGTLTVDLYLTSGGVDTLVETIYFEAATYTRSRSGIAPSRIVTYNWVGAGGTRLPVSAPAARTVSGSNGVYTVTLASETNTRLIYDYSSGYEGWKLLLDDLTPAGETRFSKLNFTFEIGKYNVINSIVPREGYNWDFVTSAGGNYTNMLQNMPNRFHGNQDWYATISSPEYRDAEDDFIDDYSVTFGVNMIGEYGNGNADPAKTEYIRYREAFLFNGLDEMFSMIHLTTPFDKNELSAYYISWTILAPIS